MSFVQYLHESHNYRFTYHDHLNPKIWNSNKTLKSKIRIKLSKIANEFFDFLEVSPDYHLVDATITGSNCNYNYTGFSDIDLHLIVDKTPDYCNSCGLDLRDVLDTKKKAWGDDHSITIYGYPVEVYVQLKGEELDAAGVYSITNNKWNIEPDHIDDLENKINKYAIEIKAKDIKNQIDVLAETDSDDVVEIKKLKTRIKDMRQAGLRKAGEFSVENLVFKELRNSGYLEKLEKLKIDAYDKSLSLF